MSIRINEKLYRVRLFKERGFKRLKCRVCGAYFWSLTDRDTCGDAPCTPYSFIDNAPVKKFFENISELRECYLKFFEKHGHSRVKRYPVVALRWRSDVYFVGASIYNFQPWVTEGIIPPPANPLVISQPCIRLTDVEIVGRSGRHLTGFEMMAHHAFNYPDKYVYWIDETVELAHEFFTKELGVSEEEITYKESIWSGGGNAGECFEVLVRGLEIATLVFMHYKIKDNEVIELPLKIVDTGYGLERIYWLCTGDVTIYDAVFKDYINRVREILGLEKIDKELVKKLTIELSKYSAEELNKPGTLQEISKKLNINYNEIERLLLENEFIYSLADHSRSLIWMFCDGVIPSNSGIGYLARLLIRRILKYMHILGIEYPLTELFSIHMKLLVNDYPEIKEFEKSIIEIIDLEEKKFRELINKGEEIVSKYVKKGKKTLNVDDFVFLYDSYGLPPEIVKSITKSKFGIEVEIPENFYAKLIEKHGRIEENPETKKIDLTINEVKDIERTRELYYENPYLSKAKAKVLKVLKGKYVILNQTCFYPEGGGQPCDIGIIKHSKGISKVINVQRIGNVIVHEVENNPPNEGEEVEIEIDFERRNALMKMHTGTHILLQSIKRVLGPHIWQCGVQKDIPFSRLDVTHYKLPTIDEIKKIEEIANSIIQMNLPVKTMFLNRIEAESKFGFTIYQGGFIPSPIIRIVQIGENNIFDAQACAGTHVKQTGEIGLIKITKVEKIQEGVIRFIFTTGKHALEYVQKLENDLIELAKEIEASKENVVSKVRELKQNIKEIENRLKLLEKKLLAYEIEDALRNAVNVQNIPIIVKIYEKEKASYLQKLGEELTIKKRGILIVFNIQDGGVEYRIYVNPEISKLVNAKDLVKLINEIIKGKGGGSTTYGQGFTQTKEFDVESLKMKIIDYVKSRLG